MAICCGNKFLSVCYIAWESLREFPCTCSLSTQETSFDWYSTVGVQEELQAMSSLTPIACLWVAMGDAATQKQHPCASLLNMFLKVYGIPRYECRGTECMRVHFIWFVCSWGLGTVVLLIKPEQTPNECRPSMWLLDMAGRSWEYQFLWCWLQKPMK